MSKFVEAESRKWHFYCFLLWAKLYSSYCACWEKFFWIPPEPMPELFVEIIYVGK